MSLLIKINTTEADGTNPLYMSKFTKIETEFVFSRFSSAKYAIIRKYIRK